MPLSNRSNTGSARLGTDYPERTSYAVAQVSMTSAEKQRLTLLIRDHNLSLSAFLRMAANDYIQRNDWE